MTLDAYGHREQTIADYFAVVRRYKWLIVVAALVVPTAAYFRSAHQPKVFRATADVLLNRQDLGSTLTGIPSLSSVADRDPERYARTQADLAKVPTVTEAAVEKAGIEGLEGWGSDVFARGGTDILTFAAYHGDPDLAARLATAYAEAFVAYKLETDTSSIARARREIQGRLAELRRSGGVDTDAYRELFRKSQDLRTLELLLVPASVIRRAGGAGQIAPAASRNTTLGVLLGLVLGIGGAFLLNAFDRRVRDADEVEHELQMPLLAKLPPPRRSDPATIIDRPPDEATEAVGRLRTSLDFANAEPNAKVVMVTSAGAREGKSTTVTNLAIALARTGRRVVLVDLDLRRPALARLLHLPDRSGITDLANGTADLSDALNPIIVTPLRARLTTLGKTDVGSGKLEVVTAGRTRVDPGEFVETSGLTEVLHNLRNHADIVLVDAPPILAVSDAMALTGKVDAILLVSRLGALTRTALRDLARVLGRSPAPVLGWVATGAKVDESYAYYRAEDLHQAPSRPRATESGPPAQLEVPEPRSASAGSGRWTPRRSGN